MRATLLIAVIFSTFLFSCGGEDVTPYDVPVAVANAFLREYPEATELNWERVGGDYEAGFTMISTSYTATDTLVDTLAYKALFNANTELLKYKFSIDTADFPTAIQAYKKANFEPYKTDVAEKLIDYTTRPDTVFYQARFKRVTGGRTLISDLVFSEDGQLQDQEVRPYWE